MRNWNRGDVYQAFANYKKNVLCCSDYEGKAFYK